MGSHAEGPKGPDLAQGVPFASLSDGDLLEGHIGEESDSPGSPRR